MAAVDFVAYPPTSFPVRDLLVLEQLPLGPDERVCELGIGSGGTTARLAKRCARVVGFEISEPTVFALRYLEARHANLSLVVADVTNAASLTPFAGAFTRLVACDTLEHVVDPRGFFRAVATLLAPGGRYLVTFPNEPRDRMHGITRYDSLTALRADLDAAGLANSAISSATLTPRAACIASALADTPIALVRALRSVRPRKNRSPSAPAPQTFDQTAFYKSMATWRRLAPAINAYWFATLKLMGEPAFSLDPAFARAPFTNTQILISGQK